MKRIEANGLQYYQSDLFNNIPHGIFTRHGGVSAAPWTALNVGGTVGDDVEAVRHNHRLMYEVLDVNADKACTTWQVHGADVVLANGPVQGRKWVARADGVMTNQADVPLVMRYADCVPLLFHDAKKQAIGLAHAGWRGTVEGMGKNMIHAMQTAYGSRPADIHVVIGPSISPEKFQVGEEVVAAFEAHFGTLDGLMQRDPDDGTAYIDLWEANRRDLVASGVENIEIAGICTYQTTEDFFSHRAENGKTGRFGVVMQL
ncbi:MAG: peptidoglycan editing factor PgeF [Phototrophicaceae bacterium]